MEPSAKLSFQVRASGGAGRQKSADSGRAPAKVWFQSWQNYGSSHRLADCNGVEDVLRAVLGGYNKRRLNSCQFNRQSVVEACARARRLDGTVAWSVPEGYAAQVHRLWEAIAEGAAPHQLPPEFQGILT